MIFVIYLPRKITDFILAVLAVCAPWGPTALTAPLTPVVPGPAAFRKTPTPAPIMLHVDAC